MPIENSFQSHYGLILSKLINIRQKISFIAFNPTMVWFYLVIAVYTKLIEIFMTFNPTMVWFYRNHYNEVRWRSIRLSIPLWSDFISGHSFSGWLVLRSFLSIPLWSDFISKSDVAFNKTRRNFQSHYGLILSQVITGREQRRGKLSIPLWSDFISHSHRRFSADELSIPLWSDFIARGS